ncbi:MAG TPA: hypothetical protein PLR83_07825 [Pyrinomonadaceae bacterium]|nr:hypothetical protein [Pyrinomonadaceae bacterium]
MKIRTSLFRPLAVCVAAILISAAAFAQEPTDRGRQSFDFVLTLVEGSSASSAGSDFPADWKTIEKTLRPISPAKAFRPIGTFQARGGTDGSVYYEGIWIERGTQIGRFAKVQWNVASIAAQESYITSKIVNFSLQIPAVINVQQPEKSRDDQTFKLFLNGVGLPVGVPTVLGTLNIDGGSAPVYIVLTVRTTQR